MGTAVRVGIGPIAWLNDDLREWGQDFSVDRVLDEIAAAAYQGTEMSYAFPRDPRVLGQELSRRGLSLAAAYLWLNLARRDVHAEELRRGREHVDFCAATGAVAIVAEGTGSLHWDRRGEGQTVQPLDREGWALLTRGLNELGRYASERGVKLCFHPHVGTAVERMSEIRTVLAGTDPLHVGLCADTGHMLLAGEDPLAVLEEFRTRVRHVHLKDIRPEVVRRAREASWTFKEAVRNNVFCPPGDGGLDFREFLSPLLAGGYAGWLIVEVEQDPRRYPPFDAARAARRYLREVIGL